MAVQGQSKYEQQNPLVTLSAQSYGAYIVHLPLMICIQNVFDGVWMGAFGKFVFVGVVTTVLSFALTWLLHLLPGVKRVL